mgnify:FL=1
MRFAPLVDGGRVPLPAPEFVYCGSLRLRTLGHDHQECGITDTGLLALRFMLFGSFRMLDGTESLSPGQLVEAFTRTSQEPSACPCRFRSGDLHGVWQDRRIVAQPPQKFKPIRIGPQAQA